MNRRLLISLVLAAASTHAIPAQGQTAPSAPTAGAYGWFGRFGLVCGGGSSHAADAAKPTAQCGGLFSGPFFNLEAGVMGPQARQSSVSGYLSADGWLPFRNPSTKHGFPLVMAGYTRMFETGSAFNYGIAYAYPVDSSHSIQFEARDYWIVADPQQHNVMLRVAWLVGLPD